MAIYCSGFRDCRGCYVVVMVVDTIAVMLMYGDGDVGQ